MKRFSELLESKAFIYGTLLWFSFQGFIFSITTKYAIPPDERYHREFINLYFNRGINPFLTGPQPGFEWLGDLTRIPNYLYHYLFGLLSHINQSLVFLRLLNLGIAVLGLWVAYLILRELRISKVTTGIVVFMVANTQMYIFLASSINYDNLLILLSFVSIWLLLKVIRSPSLLRYLFLIAVMGITSLVKFTFIPLGLLISVVAFAVLVKNANTVFGKAGGSRNEKMKIVGAAVLVVFTLSLVAERYALNYVRHGSLIPSCEKVQGFEYCKDNPSSKRRELIKNNPRPVKYDSISYFPKWAGISINNIFSAHGHEDAPASKVIIPFWLAMSLLAIISFPFVVKWDKDKVFLLIICLALAYAATVYAHNYNGYTRTGRVGLAAQGRYLFPVLPILFAAVVEFILRSKNMVSRYAPIAILPIFMLSGLPNYLVASPSTMRSGTADYLFTQANKYGCSLTLLYESRCK